ncbi:MAG: hypothetical protein M3069_27860 [Chloroflexota bacterium]|nr:hypothetical protein [Chloroflexota bacterium]
MWEQVAGNTGGTVGGLAWARMHGRACVYAATSVGVYRSFDGAQTWTLAGIRNSVPFAEAVVPSARFAQDRTIFVCAGDGLYRSSDGGESWQPVLVGGRMLSVASAHADAREGVVLLAGTEADGVLRSEDGGRSWTGANAGLLDLTALAIALSPEFAADRLGFAGTPSGLYRTRNAARSWREVETGLTEPAVQCVSISPMFADDRLVLAGTEADGLLRSEDAGATWHRPTSLIDEGVTAVAFSNCYASKPLIAAAVESGISVSEDAGRAWRRSSGSSPGMVLSLTFAPVGDGEILLAGLHRHGVAWSEDLGASWESSNTGLSARLLTGLVLSPAFAHDQTLFACGPQDGVSVSLDGGRTWAERNTGLDDTTVLGLAASPAYAQDRTLYIASAAGIHVSRDAAGHWEPSPEASASARAVATLPARGPGAGTPARAESVVAALAGGTLLASDDGARTWHGLAAIAEGAEILLVALSPDFARDRTIFVATRQTSPDARAQVVVWRSVDAGERWSRWLVEHEVGAAAGQRFIALAVAPSYATDEIVFAGLGAQVFTPVRHARQVRAGQRRPVWRGANLGEGAVAITAIAPSTSFAADRTVFASSNAGVFVSRDGGETYQPWSEGLTPPGTLSLAISPTSGEGRLVYALGLGGTIWRRHDQDPSTS